MQVASPAPTEVFIKGDMSDFNDVVFGRFSSLADRDVAVKKVSQAKLSFDGQKLWAKQDKPLMQRIPESVLFGIKRLLMTKMDLHRGSLWVHLSTRELHFEKELAIRVTCQDGVINLTYGTEWETYMTSEDPGFEDIAKDANAKLRHFTMKGRGKGSKTPTDE